MATKTISLFELRKHIKNLDRLVSDAWLKPGHPAEISFADVRQHASAISAMVSEDSTAPHAATATKAPSAATDKAPPFDPSTLGLYHIHKG